MIRKNNLILTFAGGELIFKDNCFWAYIKSLENIPDADPVILTDNMPEFVEELLLEREVTVIRVPPNDINFLYRDRHLSFWKYLNEHGHKYEHVLTTDCRDVVFQTNPFDWITDWKDRYKNIKGCHTFLNHFVILVSEGFKISQSGFACVEQFEFQRDVPLPFFKEDHNRWVVNGGTFLGSSRAMQDWHFLVWITTMKTIGRCTDQAAVNWLMYYLEDDDTYQISFPQHDHLCLTGEGIKEKTVQLIIENDVVFSPQNKPYCILHQWDRVDDLKEKILAKFH